MLVHGESPRSLACALSHWLKTEGRREKTRPTTCRPAFTGALINGRLTGGKKMNKKNIKEVLFEGMNEKGDAGGPWSTVCFPARFRNGNVQFPGSDGRHRASLQPPPTDVLQNKKVSLRES